MAAPAALADAAFWVPPFTNSCAPPTQLVKVRWLALLAASASWPKDVDAAAKEKTPTKAGRPAVFRQATYSGLFQELRLPYPRPVPVSDSPKSGRGGVSKGFSEWPAAISRRRIAAVPELGSKGTPYGRHQELLSVSFDPLSRESKPVVANPFAFAYCGWWESTTNRRSVSASGSGQALRLTEMSGP